MFQGNIEIVKVFHPLTSSSCLCVCVGGQLSRILSLEDDFKILSICLLLLGSLQNTADEMR